MNKSDSLKKLFDWVFATKDCRVLLTGIYVKDLMFYHDERGWVNIFKGEGSHTHQQGIPKGTDDSYKIICNTRNPYTMCFSSWTDINEETGEYETLAKPILVDIEIGKITFQWILSIG